MTQGTDFRRESERERERDKPFKVDSLDDEPQRRADGVDVLVHNLLDNRRLASVVQATISIATREVSTLHLADLVGTVTRSGPHVCVKEDEGSFRTNFCDIQKKEKPEDSQHQYPHLLVLQPRLAQDGQHIDCFLVCCAAYDSVTTTPEYTLSRKS